MKQHHCFQKQHQNHTLEDALLGHSVSYVTTWLETRGRFSLSTLPQRGLALGFRCRAPLHFEAWTGFVFILLCSEGPADSHWSPTSWRPGSPSGWRGPQPPRSLSTSVWSPQVHIQSQGYDDTGYYQKWQPGLQEPNAAAENKRETRWKTGTVTQ